MNWIATNIRFPEDEYMKLKMVALQKRVSFASLIREAVKKVVLGSSIGQKRNILIRLDRVAKVIGKRTGKGWNSVKALREVRYQ